MTTSQPSRVMTKPKALAFSKKNYLRNPLDGLDKSVSSGWCRRVIDEITCYRDAKLDEGKLRSTDYYVPRIRQLQEEIHDSWKSVFDLEKENKTRKAMGRAFNRSLKLQIKPLDNLNEVTRMRWKHNELLAIVIHHAINPPLLDDEEVQDT